MSALSSLHPPQRAVLSLILAKGKTYGEIAELLQLELPAVRERAHQALDALAPSGGAKPAPRHRAAIGNYLLGQDPDAVPATLAYLRSSVAGRDWARALATELTELAAAGLPLIPADPSAGPPTPALPARSLPDPASAPPDASLLTPEAGPEEAPSPPTTRPTPAVSRRGGALLLAAALVLVAGVLAVLLIPGGHTPRPRGPTAATGATTTPKTTARLVAQIVLRASPGVTAKGFAALIARGSQRVIAIAAGGLAPSSARLTYGAWLYNSPGDALLIGFLPRVKADGRISAAASLPATAGRFHELVLTREAGAPGARPGPVLLRGPAPRG